MAVVIVTPNSTDKEKEHTCKFCGKSFIQFSWSQDCCFDCAQEIAQLDSLTLDEDSKDEYEIFDYSL